MLFGELSDLTKEYEMYLKREEKAPATISQYLRGVRTFLAFAKDMEIEKETVLLYKEKLEGEYLPASVNAYLAAVNGFLAFAGYRELCVKPLKIQSRAFCEKEKELTRDEYLRMVRTARGGVMSALP